MKLFVKRTYYIVVAALIETWIDVWNELTDVAQALAGVVIGVLTIALIPLLLLDNGRRMWRNRKFVTEKSSWRFRAKR